MQRERIDNQPASSDNGQANVADDGISDDLVTTTQSKPGEFSIRSCEKKGLMVFDDGESLMSAIDRQSPRGCFRLNSVLQ